MATTEVQEDSSKLPQNYKICTLKVSIHCEGCKKKVKKILTNIQGVHSADIETRQQKVTIISTLEPEILVKKLIKAGKPAELWPEIPDQNQKQNPLKTKKIENDQIQQNDAPKTTQQAVNADNKDIKSPSQAEKPQDSTDKTNPIGISGDGEISVKGSGDTRKVSSEVAGKNSGRGSATESTKSEGKLPETGSTGATGPTGPSDKPVDDKPANASERSAENGISGKKKKKKGQNGNKTVSEQPPSVSPAASTSTTTVNNEGGGRPPPLANQNRPRQQGYNYDHDQYPPAQPNYYTPQPTGVSYNMTHPTSSYTTSYHAAHQPPSYAYSHPGSDRERAYGYVHPGSGMVSQNWGREYPYSYPYPSSGVEHLPMDFDSDPRQRSDSYEMFSDENPNGCSIS